MKQDYRLFLFFLFTTVFTGDSVTHSTGTVGQSDGIYNSYSPVAMDLWQRKPTSPSGFALVLGWFTAINPRRPGYNYYISRHYCSCARARASIKFLLPLLRLKRVQYRRTQGMSHGVYMVGPSKGKGTCGFLTSVIYLPSLSVVVLAN